MSMEAMGPTDVLRGPAAERLQVTSTGDPDGPALLLGARRGAGHVPGSPPEPLVAAEGDQGGGGGDVGLPDA